MSCLDVAKRNTMIIVLRVKLKITISLITISLHWTYLSCKWFRMTRKINGISKSTLKVYTRLQTKLKQISLTSSTNKMKILLIKISLKRYSSKVLRPSSTW